MTVSGWEFWLAWAGLIAGLVVPLCVLAWAAYRYTVDREEERKYRRFEQFYAVTDRVGEQGGSIVSKVAAVYELRRFPDYADVIVRLTESPDIRGSGRPVEMLSNEFKLTHDEMKRVMSDA